MPIEFWTAIIAALGAGAGSFFSMLARSQADEVRHKTTERSIDEIKESIKEMQCELKNDLNKYSNDISGIKDRLSIVEGSTRTAHTRIDNVEKHCQIHKSS